MCFEVKWLQNRLRADKNESKSFLAVDIKGHQRGGLCIVPIDKTFFQMRSNAFDASRWTDRTFIEGLPSKEDKRLIHRRTTRTETWYFRIEKFLCRLLVIRTFVDSFFKCFSKDRKKEYWVVNLQVLAAFYDFFLIESFPQMCFEGKWLRDRFF